MENILNVVVMLSSFLLIPALSYGAQLALGALGVTLIYSILRFANFAHGDMMALGGAVAILFTALFQSWGIGLGPLPTALLALPPAIAVTALYGMAADKVVFRHYRINKAEPVVLSIASVGLMFITNALVRFTVGPELRTFNDGEKFLVRARDFKAATGLAEGLTIKMSQVITLGVAVLAVVALFWFLQNSRTGKAMRALSDNSDLALLSGISPDRIVGITWLIAAALATLAGVLYGLDKVYKPFTYFQLLLPIFAAAIVGGIGRPIGAVVGGFVIAFSEVIITYPFRKVVGYLTPGDERVQGLVQLLSTEYKFAVSFVILVIVLIYRPTGIMRGRVI